MVPPYPSLPRLPIAQTSFAEAPSTSVRRFCVGSGLGLGTTAQLVPFQCWTRVRTLGAVEVENVPTAQALLVEKVLTPERDGPTALGGLGLGTMVHELPFHRSVSEPESPVPTPRRCSTRCRPRH